MPGNPFFKRSTVCGLLAFPLTLILTGLPNIALAQEPEQAIDSAIEDQASADDDSQQSQQLIDEMDDDTSLSIAENRLAMQELNRLIIYNSNLDTVVQDQEREKASLERQIADFGDVERDVVPFMFEMIDAIEAFIELDLPFSKTERRDRLARLKTGMERSDLTVSEKFRLIMEAYQIEASYGRNIEAYIGTLNIEGVERRVNLLRIGRIVLAYQTLDGADTGYWDRAQGKWLESDTSFRREVADGLRIARKQMAPRLLELPVPAAGAVQ